MIDYVKIVNDAKVRLIDELERFEAQQHVDREDQDRMGAIGAQIRILNQIHTEMLHQENIARDRDLLAQRRGGAR